MFRRVSIALALIASFPNCAHPQHSDMPGMQMPMPPSQANQAPMKMDMPLTMSATTLIEAQLNHTSSGTSIEPASTPVPMLMSSYKGWTLMLHGTAFITDAGMVGPLDSVIGIRKELSIERFLTQRPGAFEVAKNLVYLQGAVVDIDEASGRALSCRSAGSALALSISPPS